MSIDIETDDFSSLVEACLIQVLASNEWLERRILASLGEPTSMEALLRVLVDRGMSGPLESHARVLSSED